MEAVIWRKLGVSRGWPAVVSALVYALAAAILLLLATNATAVNAAPPGPAAVQATPIPAPTLAQGAFSPRSEPCTCRMARQDYAIGDQVCIRGQRAVCDRVLNNTSWRFLGEACPLS